MGIATFKTVAAGDGSPHSPSGYCYYLVFHAVATALLLITLVAAIWQFMNWIAEPSCPRDVSLASVSAPVGASHHLSARGDSGCPCPHEPQHEKA
ncbi:hypothetical protein AWB92_03425 [Mycobacterium sp. IEC1808]|uniref:hypothetical protein n=1 Tax=Mycobacterium sp. IEC1808 TaxID=1743230 RepID=UPI000A161B95|nr:hypothetical protein [Mycobacterium sp. IEC1808]ORW97714.1 hypothetical protein AWB92_03425 [Mycobacterium sp. IEC1808]